MANGPGHGEVGGGACGHESVVPHKGLLAGPLKTDATWGYVVVMYL